MLTIAATTLFFSHDLGRAIAIVVVATPTALVVAGPAAMVCAMSRATRLRILIKSTDFLERATEVDTLILDKTGTVTIGAPTVTGIFPADGVDEGELLGVAASCGFGSRHPVSRAVVGAARRRGIEVTAPEEASERPGLGVLARINGEVAALGRPALLAQEGLAVTATLTDPSTDVCVARGRRYLGRLTLCDIARAEARDAVQQMRELGLERVVLLTGDRAAIAEEVGNALGVDEIVADVLPEEKLAVVRRLQAEGRTVMMVGDGVNDALALGGADVGVAIGAELNEVALGGADVALLGADLGRLPRLLRLADRTRRVIGQNVWIAFWLAALLIVLAAGGVVHPLAGAAAQSLAVLAVVGNSTRILREDDPQSAAAG